MNDRGGFVPPSRMTIMYGGAPDPQQEWPARPYPNYEPLPITTTGSKIEIARTAQKATVAARVDEHGRLWLRISIDGRHVAEIEGDPSGLTLTVDV